MGLLVKLFIEDTKQQLSVLIQDCKDDHTPEKTILNVTLPLPTKNDSVVVSDIDECTNDDLADEARMDVKPDISNMQVDNENDANIEDDHISVCDSVNDDVKPPLCVTEEVIGENTTSISSSQDKVNNEANTREKNLEDLMTVDVQCGDTVNTYTNENNASDSQNEEPLVSDDSDLHEITFVDSEVNEENTEDNVGTNPLETPIVDTITSEVANVDISDENDLRKNTEKSNVPEKEVEEVSYEELELQLTADDLLEMNALNTSNDFSEQGSEQDENSPQKTNNRIEDQQSSDGSNEKVVDLTEERENRGINRCQSTSDERENYMVRRTRNTGTNSVDDEPVEITVEDNDEGEDEIFEEEFEEIDFTGSDEDEEDLEYIRLKRNNPYNEEISSIPAYDVDSESEDENEQFRRDNDVLVVDLTEEKQKGNGRNQYECIDLTSEKTSRRSNDECYIPMMVPAKRTANDVIRDLSNFYVENKSLIEETQEALVNFEPKSPEPPRDYDRKFWHGQRHREFRDRCIESAPWNGAGCSESRPKIPKLTNNAVCRASPNYELPSQSDECMNNPHMNSHVLQNAIPVLNTNWSGNFRQFNRRSRFPSRMRGRCRFVRGPRGVCRERLFGRRPQQSQPTACEPEIRLKMTTRRGKLWIH